MCKKQNYTAGKKKNRGKGKLIPILISQVYGWKDDT